MSQTWTDNVFQVSHAYDTDLGNMENNFASLKTLFSGASAPASMGACHPWFDTTKHVLKVRSDGNAAWYGLMHGDTSQKMWVYRNAAMAGWAVDSSLTTDFVLGIKNSGAGQSYTVGAATAGSWTISGLTNSAAHTHTGPSHTHTASAATDDGSNSQAQLDPAAGTPSVNFSRAAHTHVIPATSASGTAATGAPSVAETITSGGTWRAAAAVGCLMYLDL